MDLRTAYEYATRNGYTGSFEQYQQLQYRAYCSVCRRCGMEAKLFSEWVQA